MTSPMPLHVWLEQLPCVAGTVVNALDDDTKAVVCTKLEDGAWRVEPAPPPTFEGSALDRWVGYSGNAVVQEEWEKLREYLRNVVHDLLPPHDVNEPYLHGDGSYTISGDDLDSLLWHADHALTIVDSHEFVASESFPGYCRECVRRPDSPSHLDADRMMRDGAL